MIHEEDSLFGETASAGVNLMVPRVDDEPADHCEGGYQERERKTMKEWALSLRAGL